MRSRCSFTPPILPFSSLTSQTSYAWLPLLLYESSKSRILKSKFSFTQLAETVNKYGRHLDLFANVSFRSPFHKEGEGWIKGDFSSFDTSFIRRKVDDVLSESRFSGVEAIRVDTICNVSGDRLMTKTIASLEAQWLSDSASRFHTIGPFKLRARQGRLSVSSLQWVDKRVPFMFGNLTLGFRFRLTT
ncbi:hypothetical protein TNCV_1523761 [Trichonephila clavipes]|nr:hypothetical protein TNCV_1523761 [Trichonephila clavipes]